MLSPTIRPATSLNGTRSLSFLRVNACKGCSRQLASPFTRQGCTIQHMRVSAAALLFVTITPCVLHAQRRPPEIGRQLSNPGPDRIEVRFADGEKTVTCEKFHLTAKSEGDNIINGEFNSGFRVPPSATKLPRKDALQLEFTCGTHRWRFTKVPETVFESSWWWVGTDYPPFQETFQGSPDFQDAVWIRYLIVDPQGFFVERHCPAKFKDQKPGPCYLDD